MKMKEAERKYIHTVESETLKEEIQEKQERDERNKQRSKAIIYYYAGK